MSRLFSSSFMIPLGGLLLLGTITVPCRVVAQEAETAKIVTVDGVKLNAVFYPSAKKNSATVILLHPIGEGKSIKLPGWRTLAETLQKTGFAVIMFDFRGHGDSTTIEDPAEFWKYGPNKQYVMNKTKERDTIEYKDYKKTEGNYLPVLINDIAAVKAFLERKNDAGSCNTANTVVIGAENGATLGAIWINSEWNRYRVMPPPNMFAQPQLDKKSEGGNIIGMVWLNISPALGTRKVSVSKILDKACKVHITPAVFLFGEKDNAAKKLNLSILDALKPKNSKKHDGIVEAQVPNTNLSGVKLLEKGLKTDDFIAKYVQENILEAKNNEWEAHEFQTSVYAWKTANSPVPAVAKSKMEKILRFDSYEKFISQ